MNDLRRCAEILASLQDAEGLLRYPTREECAFALSTLGSQAVEPEREVVKRAMILQLATIERDVRVTDLTDDELGALADAILATLPASPIRREAEEQRQFWLIVREPGMVPDRKGPWKFTETAKVLREFMAANPTAFIDYLTLGDDGTPHIEHGPMVLQYTDGRSMSVGRRHNKRVRVAALAALASAPKASEK